MNSELSTNAEPVRPIVVGVDGSRDSLHAARWAAAEAAREGRPVRLVNAYERPPAMFPAMAVELPAPHVVANEILSEAQIAVATDHPDLDVTITMHEGPAPQILLKEGEGAHMLVTGREGVGRFSELVLGSVSLAVATRATVPTAVIPAAWRPPVGPYGRVVVGVDGSENCQAAVEFAFEAVSVRRAELVAAFAWRQPARIPEDWAPGGAEERVAADSERLVAESIVGWRDKYPDVPVTTISEVGHPAQVLRRLAEDADLVVIGGRGHGTVTGMLLGSVARSILRHVDRPVVVVHRPKK